MDNFPEKSFLDGAVKLHHGDCLAVLDTVPDNSVDACICDPPYHLTSIVKRFGKPGSAPVKIRLVEGQSGSPFERGDRGFMGKEWDGGDIAFQAETWRKVYRVMKPGAHLVAFAAPKNFDLLYSAIREAGFEVRDSIFELFSLTDLERGFLESLSPQQSEALAAILDHREAFGALAWTFGSAMPKSHAVGKAIDKAARGAPHGGADPMSPNHGQFRSGCSEDNPTGQSFGPGASRWIVTGKPVKRLIPGADQNKHGWEKNNGRVYVPHIELPATAEAAEWAGWGSGLKPAIEPIVLARKPLDGTIAENTLRWGTGALNVDACRIETDPDVDDPRLGGKGDWDTQYAARNVYSGGYEGNRIASSPLGRWPANLVHDGSDEVLAAFPDSDGQNGLVSGQTSGNQVYGGQGPRKTHEPREDSGSAARFFASFPNGRDGEASAEKRYTEEGSTNFAMKPGARREPVEASRFFYSAKADAVDRLGSNHPTQKPVDLMCYLARLVCAKGGTILDPFAGTGSTGEAAWREGMKAVLIEREAEYCADIEKRMEHALSSRQTRKREHLKRRGKVQAAGPLFE